MKVLDLVMDYRKLNKELEIKERLNVPQAIPEFSEGLIKLRQELHATYREIEKSYKSFSVAFSDNSDATISIVLKFVIDNGNDVTESFRSDFEEYISKSDITAMTQAKLLHPDLIDLMLDFLRS